MGAPPPKSSAGAVLRVGAAVAQIESENEGVSWPQRRNSSTLGPSVVPGTVAEPAVGGRIHRLSCVLRSDDGSGFKRDDLRRTEFICVGMKTCKNH